MITQLCGVDQRLNRLCFRGPADVEVDHTLKHANARVYSTLSVAKWFDIKHLCALMALGMSFSPIYIYNRSLRRLQCHIKVSMSICSIDHIMSFDWMRFLVLNQEMRYRCVCLNKWNACYGGTKFRPIGRFFGHSLTLKDLDMSASSRCSSASCSVKRKSGRIRIISLKCLDILQWSSHARFGVLSKRTLWTRHSLLQKTWGL